MIENAQPTAPRDTVRGIKILSTAMITGVIVFAGVAIFVEPSMDKITGLDEIFLIIACSLAAICFFTASKKVRDGIQAIHENNESIDKKLVRYRSMIVVYNALCEAPALFSLIAFMLTGVNWLLIIVAVMLSAMIYRYPATSKLIRELELEWSEVQQIQ